MARIKSSFISIFIAAAAMVFLGGSVCQRTVIRNGVRVSVDQAIAMDMQRAQRLSSEGNHQEAASIYESLIEEFPRSERKPEIMVELGAAYYAYGDGARAEETFNQVIQSYPRTPYEADAAWGLCLIAYQEKDCRKVESLINEHRPYAEGNRWDQMTSLMAECSREDGDLEGALILFGEEYRDGRDPEFRDKAKQRAETTVKDISDEGLAELASMFTSQFPGDLVLMELIQRAADADRLEEAKDLIATLEGGYPDSSYLAGLATLKSQVEKWSKIKPNRIGVLLPLSGSYAALGERTLQGMMMAAGVFNKQAPLLSAELIIRDLESGKGTAEELVEQLVSEEHVIAIVGPLRSSMAKGAAVKAQELGVPIVVLSPDEDVTDVGSMVYQNCLSREEQIEALVDYAAGDRGIKDFAVMYPNDRYGAGYYFLFTEEISKKGGFLKASESYAPDTTDFKNEIRSLKGKGVGAVFIPDSARKVAMIAPQIRYHKVEGITLLGINAWHSRELLEQTQPDDIEGALFTDGIAPEARRPSFNQFARNFEGQYGSQPGIIEAQAYESVDLLLYLIGTYHVRDREQLKTALDHVADYPGALGLITVKPGGKWKKPVYLFTVHEGEFKLVHNN